MALARLLPDWVGTDLTDGIVVIEFPLDPAHPEYTADYKPYKIKLSEWIGGAGTLDHAALTSNLGWLDSGHTGTPSRLMATDSEGDATEIELGTNLSITDGVLNAAGGGASELPGSGIRIVEASDGAGTLSATKTIVNAKLTDATTITRLTDTANWDINGAYTGTAITGTYEGQYYRNDEYFFFAYADNDWIRMIRL